MVLERFIVDYSAAVLANRKVGNLFLYPNPNERFEEEFLHCERRLCPFGISMMGIKVKTGILVYVFRPDRLEEVLKRSECRTCLTKRGYQVTSVEALLEGFRQKIQQSEFPHEIGFILGYPTRDVLSYLEDMGRNPLLTGYWQVYHDVEEARKTFRELSQCYANYKTLYADGTPLEELPIVKGNCDEKDCYHLLECNRQYRTDGPSHQ